MFERRLLIPGFRRILHGGDYDPDQWQNAPAILEEDARLMKLASVNTVTLGTFAWSSYEPTEGHFTFEWLDRAMDAAARAGQHVILATPSGAKPPWLGRRYAETRRVDRQGLREPYTGRHNHCWSSPVYREKVGLIDRRLAERYAKHPALGMWHVSNELGGECYCILCAEAFRAWLRERYGTIAALNDAWWSSFSSHCYAAWEEIEPRDATLDALLVDYRRFNTDQAIDFLKWEMEPLRELSPNVPCTTNFMGSFAGIDYARVAETLDVVSEDQAAAYDGADPEAWRVAVGVSMKGDLYRGLKPGQPWMLRESRTEAPPWKQPMRAQRPNVHRTEMLQALAHGAEGTGHVQWRKGRGGSGKFHGAVVDHAGHENTRAFETVADLGREYERLGVLLGSTTPAEVALVYDWEVRWAFECSAGPDHRDGAYERGCVEHYRPFWQAGISVDVLDSTRSFDGYRVLVTPQLFMLRPGVAKRLRGFVENGGTWVTTLYTGYCDSTNRCFLGGFPGDGLGEVLGVWSEEWDVLAANTTRSVRAVEDPRFPLAGTLRAAEALEVLHARGATVLGEHTEDYYAGHPALTVNAFGRGQAYYLGARFDDASLDAFYTPLFTKLGLHRNLAAPLPRGVTAQRRVQGERELVFVMNFTPAAQRIALGNRAYRRLSDDALVEDALVLEPFASVVLTAP